LTMKNARVTTVSGSIRARATLDNAAPYTFDTVSGDIDLETTLPGSGASLTFRAVSGDADVSGDWIRGSGKRTWQLAGGSEGPAIRVKAVSGGLDARATSDASQTLRHETAPQDQDEHEPDTTGDSGIGGDFDWERAKDWVGTMARNLSQALGEMDESTSRQTPPEAPQELPESRREADTERVPGPASAAETEPVTPSPAWTNSAPVTPPQTEETTGQRRLRLLESVQR